MKCLFLFLILITACGGTEPSVEEQCRQCNDLSSERSTLPMCQPIRPECEQYMPLPDCLNNPHTLVSKAKSDVGACARRDPCSVGTDPATGREVWLYCAENLCSASCWWSTRVYFDGNIVDHLYVRMPPQ